MRAVGTFVLNSEGQLVQSSDQKRKPGRPRKDEVRLRDDSRTVAGMQHDPSFSDEDNNNDDELLHCSPMPMTSMSSYVKSIVAPGEVMGMRKKLDPVKSGRLETSLKIQEPVEIDGDDLSSGFSLDKVNDIMAKYFATSNDEPNSMSREEQAMKADKIICSSDGLNDGVRVATSAVDVPNVEIDRASNEVEKEHGADNIENHQSTSTVDDMKIDDVDNCTNKGGVDTAERHKVQHAKNYDNSELSVNICSRATGTNVDITSCINQERSYTGCSFVSYANDHASVSENSFVCNSILEELQPGRGTSETDLVCPSEYRQGYNLVNHANNTSSRPAFGSGRSGQESNAISGIVTGINAQTPSLVLSEDNQLFATESGIFRDSVLNDKLIRVPVNGLPCPSGGEQTPVFGENGALSTSKQFDNTQCLEGLKSSRLEQFEPNFLTAQASSHSKESNVLSYDESIEQGFNAAGWPEKVALSSVPNIESRREIDSCVLCKNEPYHDAYGAGMQTGSVGIMCANCQGKFSGHVSFL